MLVAILQFIRLFRFYVKLHLRFRHNYIHMSICFVFLHFYVEEFYPDCYLFPYIRLLILFSNLLALCFLTDDQHIYI